MFKRTKKPKTRDQGSSVDLTRPGHTAAYEVVASLVSDVGCVREANEDSGKYTCPDNLELRAARGVLVIVADGMGGHSAGEVASRLAVDLISRAYYEDADDPQAALARAFNEANRAIHQASLNDESLSGMGTTCTALALRNGSAISAHVGDSRLYLIRAGQIYLMTEDHSAVMEMVKRGVISLDEARRHPDKNVILRAMGSHPEVEISTWREPFPVRQGDQFVLCSDGLYDLVEDEEIKRAVIDGDPNTACENLVSMAKERGGHDNITVAVVSLRQPGVGTISPARPVPVTRVVEVAE